MNRTTRTLLGIATPVVVAGLIAWAASDNGVHAAGLPAIVWLAIASFAINWLAFIPAWLNHTEHFYDLTGSFTYFVLVALALALGEAEGANWLLAILIWVWAARLGSFLFRRVRKAGSDGRFDKIKHRFLQFLMFWTIQALWVFLTAAAALTAMTSAAEHKVGAMVIIGLIVWVVGMAIEIRADMEKSAFRADPANDGRFITTGLWARSRHPNYFGELTLWIGIALIAIPGLSGWQFVTLVSPVFVFVLLTRISGVPALEARADKRWGGEPAYQDYKKNTPVFFPWGGWLPAG